MSEERDHYDGRLNGDPVISWDGEVSRREAATFDWIQLSRWQQNAVINCHLLLQEIAGMPSLASAAKDRWARVLPQIDRERRNNAVLIDGRRGSGKTIVLFTLLRYWLASSTAFKHLSAESSPTFQTHIDRAVQCRRDERDGALPPEAKGENVEQGSFHVIPIGPVDLQYLSPSTQIVPLIANAFRKVVDALQDVNGKPTADGTPPWLSLPGSAPPLSDLWRDFMSSASAWEVDSRERHLRVDPEEYFIEVGEMESHRAQLQEKFRKFADELTRQLSHPCAPGAGKAPLIVLCVDDADMKPQVSVRLLEALRVLYHNRVAFLLTGSSDLFVNMLEDQFFANMRSPLRRLSLEGDQPDEVMDRSFAQRLAREVYGKVIPTGHRIEVPRLAPEDRFITLRQVVDRVTAGAVVEAKNGADDGTKKGPQPAEGAVKGEAERPAETRQLPLTHYLEQDPFTLNALPEQLRDMWSLRDFVLDRIEKTRSGLTAKRETKTGNAPVMAAARDEALTHPELPILVVQKLWDDAIADALLSRPAFEALTNVIRVETHPNLRFFVNNTAIKRNILSVPMKIYRRREGATLSFRRIVGYEMYLDEKYGRAVLSEAAEGALILATDLAADYPYGDFVAASLSPDEFDNPFVVASLQSKEMRGSVIDFVWPLPDWDAFVDFHIFSMHWKAIVEMSKDGQRSDDADLAPGRLARLFVWLALSVAHAARRSHTPLDNERPDFHLNEGDAKLTQSITVETMKATGPEENYPKAVRWATLAGRMQALAFGTGGETSRDDINSRWARSRVALLLAPESGLNDVSARPLQEALVKAFKENWTPEAEAELLNAREDRFRRSYVHSGKERGETVYDYAKALSASHSVDSVNKGDAIALMKDALENLGTEDSRARWGHFLEELGGPVGASYAGQTKEA